MGKSEYRFKHHRDNLSFSYRAQAVEFPGRDSIMCEGLVYLAAYASHLIGEKKLQPLDKSKNLTRQDKRGSLKRYLQEQLKRDWDFITHARVPLVTMGGNDSHYLGLYAPSQGFLAYMRNISPRFLDGLSSPVFYDAEKKRRRLMNNLEALEAALVSPKIETPEHARRERRATVLSQ